MNSLIFLLLKWLMHSICLLAIGLLLFHQEAMAEDLVPIVAPDQLDALELQRFQPWLQPDLDFNVHPASTQFELPTVGPVIPMPVDSLEAARRPAVPVIGTQVQAVQNLPPSVAPGLAAEQLKKNANLPPLAKYPPPTTNPQPPLNLQTEFPALRATNANPPPKPISESKEIPAERTPPPLAKYPPAETNPDAALLKPQQRQTEEQEQIVTESDGITAPDVTTKPARTNAPNVTKGTEGTHEPHGFAEPELIFGEADENSSQSDQQVAPQAEPSDNAHELPVEEDSLPEVKAPAQITPAQITPALIVPAKPPLGTPDNSAANLPADLSPGGLATDEDDTAPRSQTESRDPFIDEGAPSEDYPRSESPPKMLAEPHKAPNQSIVPEYQAMNCGSGCCFQPEYYFLVEGVFLDRQGGPLTLSNNFSIDPFDYQLGGRFTYRSRPEFDRGVEISYVGLFNWNETASRNSAAGGLSSTFVPGTGLSAANFTAFNNATFQQQRFESSLHSIEYQNVKWGGDAAAFTAGLRYVLLQDEFQFDSVNALGQRGQFNLDTTNNLIGPQAGMNLVHDVGNGLSFSLKGKLGLMANINNGETRLDNNGFLVANNDDNVNFSALFEAGVLAHYQISPSCRLRAGYEAWLITGVATVEDNLGSTISRSTGSNIDSGDDVFLHGLTVGLELYY